MGGTGESALMSTKILYQAALAICFLCLWITIAQTTKNSQPPPAQIFWQIILAILATGVLVMKIPGKFVEINSPAASIVHVKSALLSVILAGLSFILIQRLGCLVRFRRTRRSERNWHLLILFFGLTFSQ